VTDTLSHPNIATVFRRGTTEDGRLWIAMQYIDGASPYLLRETHIPVRYGKWRYLTWDNRAVRGGRVRATDNELRGAYRVLREQFLRRCAAAGAECYFGDGPIDYRLAHGHPAAPTVHHTIPVVTAPHLEMEMSLWRPAHARCNRLGQAAFDLDGGVGEDDYGVPSEQW
jgi:hypothetical protein